MAKDLIKTHGRGRTVQAVAVLLTAIAQIATARLTDFLHVGINVELRSAVASHPLVPLGYAFAIWGAIYLFSFIAAVWQMLPEQRHDRAMDAVGWNLAGIYLVNTVWQIWVPLNGLDAISVGLVAVALILGISGLLRLRQDVELMRIDSLMMFAPLALVTGWLTAACFVNFTSMLVAGNFGLDPGQANVSLAFLMALVVFGGVMVWLTESVVYSCALVWALFWIMMANIYRDHEPAMVTTAIIGMALIGLLCAWAVTHHHESGPMELRRG